MLPPAFSPAVPLGQASAPADPNGPATSPAPARRRSDDFGGELDTALSGGVPPTAGPPPAPPTGAEVATPNPSGAGSQPLNASAAANGTPINHLAADASSGTEPSKQSKGVVAGMPAGTSVKPAQAGPSAKSDASVPRVAAVAAASRQPLAGPTEVKAAPNATNPASLVAALAPGTSLPTQTPPVRVVAVMPKPTVATPPTHFPNPGQPTTPSAIVPRAQGKRRWAPAAQRPAARRSPDPLTAPRPVPP